MRQSKSRFALIHLLAVSLILAVMAANSVIACRAASTLKPGECWVIHMSSNFLGNVTFNMGDSATSIYMEKLGIEAFGDDKMKEILILNHRDKTYLQEPRSQWKKRAAKYQAKSKNSDVKGYKVSKGTKAKICGLNCVFFEVKAIKKDGTLEPQNQRKQLWVCEELDTGKGVAKQFSMEILRVFAQLDELPSTLGVLVRLKANKSGKLVTMLDTYKIEKSKKLVELKVPKGYHRVKDEVALLWGDESSTGDMFGSP